MTMFNQQDYQQGLAAQTQLVEVLLEARNVSKTYEENKVAKNVRNERAPMVLENIQLEIRAGEFVAILGPSGSGKSTLLRILAGLLQPSEGEVLFKGVPQHQPNPHLAIVFQSFALFPWLTVLQNVELGLQAQELTRTQRMKRALAAIDAIGLDGFEDAYPKELSGGMRQRVGFARALVVEPELLFMDEPFSALDVLTAANLRKELMSMWHSHHMPTRAIVMVTHNIDDAVSMADRIVILGAHPGRIRVELPGLPHEQRGIQNEAHTALVDLIYRIMTSPQEDIAALLPAATPPTATGPLAPAAPHPYQVLPHVSIGDITGLIDLVHAHGGRADLYQIGRHLQLEVDDLLPVTEATDLLDLADTQEGDLVLTEQGQRFAIADVLEQKNIFREQALSHIALLRHIVHDIEVAPGHTVSEKHLLTFLEKAFSENEAQAQLETATNWGRYAELFTFQDERGIFRLENEEEAETR